jgi:hypothetical protein
MKLLIYFDIVTIYIPVDQKENGTRIAKRCCFPGQLSGRALDYGLDDRGFESRQGLGIFLLTTASRSALGPTQPPIQWITGALSLGVKRLGHAADHSPPSSPEVKNVWSYTSTPQYAFMAWCSVKAQGQLCSLATFLTTLLGLNNLISTLSSNTPNLYYSLKVTKIQTCTKQR